MNKNASIYPQICIGITSEYVSFLMRNFLKKGVQNVMQNATQNVMQFETKKGGSDTLVKVKHLNIYGKKTKFKG